MTKAAQGLLRKPNQLSEALRVVFTPVNKPTPAETCAVPTQATQPKRLPAGKATTRIKAIQTSKSTTRQKSSTSIDVRTESEGLAPTAANLQDSRHSKIASTQTANPRPRNSTERAEVINEQLMDDTLQYLAPTLEHYRGCTVIDIYPGSCRWSRKVHNFLTPKCHLLLEPEPRYHKYVRELVDSPQSTYKHIALPGAVDQYAGATYDQVFQEGGAVPASDRPTISGDVAMNCSILIIGSFNRKNHLRISGKNMSGSAASLHHFCYGALHNDYMHRWGPVRMLVWTPEPDRLQFLPDRTMYRTKSDAIAGLAMHIQTVVAVNHLVPRRKLNEWSSRSRWTGLHLASEDSVRSRAAALGMIVPERRVIHRVDADVGVGHAGEHYLGPSPYAVQYRTKKQFEKAVDELIRHWDDLTTIMYPQGEDKTTARQHVYSVEEMYKFLAFPGLADALLEDPSKTVKAANSVRSKIKEGVDSKSPSQPEMQAFGRSRPHDHRRALKGVEIRIAFYADAALRGINLEMHCKIFEEQGIDVSDLKQKLCDFADSIMKRVVAKKQVYYADFHRLVDDWISFFSPSQLLMVDRRQYEPLQADPADFGSRDTLCLLDCTPTTRDMEVPDLADRRKAAAACRDMIGILFQYRGQSVPTVLDRLAPNAANDLIKAVPAITDPRKGGRLNPNHLKVRQLTSEMLEGLTKAWFEWPFKPEGWELSLGVTDTESSRSADPEPLTPEAVTADDEGDLVR